MDESRGEISVPPPGNEPKDHIPESKQSIRDRVNIHPRFQGEPSELQPHREAVEKAFDSALEAITEKLDVHDVTVNIAARDLGQGHELRTLANGFAQDAHTVDFSVNPAHPDINTMLAIAIKRYLGHELHHVKRYEGPGYGTTFFDSLIFEGIAQHFERELVEADPEEYRYGISPEKMQELMSRAKEMYHDSSYSMDDHVKWFWSGSEEERIPVAAGYAIGYQIVADYLERHPDKTASSLVLTPAEEFIEPAA